MSTVAPARTRAAAYRPRGTFATAACLVAGLGLAGGGYFPTTWAWASLALFWGTALLLAVAKGERPPRRAVLFAAGLGGLAGWIALTALWTPSVGGTVLEVQRALVYVGGAGALVLFGRRAAVPQLLAGTLAGIALVATYALATRLFPERLGMFDPVAGYRLSGTVGYWNALGILCVIGLLLAVAMALRTRSLPARAAAAALLPTLATALYFTFSRGALVALVAGLVVALAVDPRRLQLALGTSLVALPACVAVWVASRSAALTRSDSLLADASPEGHRLALVVLGLTVLAAGAAVAFARAEGRFEPGPTLRRAGVIALAAAALAAVAIPLIALGGPIGAYKRVESAFAAPPASSVDLRSRVFSLSGNGRAELWRVALEDAGAHPLLGSGAGSYERFWLAHRSTAMKVRDAHSLYVETLAELGPLGFALLLAVLAIPLTAVPRARRSFLGIGVLAAYVAFLTHAAVDWDWEMAAVTVPALLCGGCLVLLGGDERARPTLSLRARCAVGAGAVALGAFALIGLAGSSALASSTRAAKRGDFAAAEAHARTAERYEPWSVEPLRALGEAQLSAGDTDAAAATLRRATARDPGDFELWLDLARTVDGAEQASALAHAASLDPLGPEVALLRSELSLEEEPARSSEAPSP